MLEVRDLKKSFGSLEVLKDINADIHRGEVISITVMLAAREVSLTMEISEFDSGGKAVRSAWGSTMRRMIWVYFMPTQ